MAEDFTTTALLSSIKRRGMIPSTTETLSTSDFLTIATEEMRTYVMPAILSVNEEYGVVPEVITVVAGQSTYPLPTRSTAEAVRLVQWTDNQNGYFPLLRIDPEHQSEYGVGAANGVQGYMLQDDSIVLIPQPAAAASLQVSYFMRPSALVLPAATATISAIASNRLSVTTSSTIPAALAGTNTYDVVDSQPGFRSLDVSAAGTGSGTTVTFSVALPSTVGVGDYICGAGESCVPQIPLEAHPLLAQRTAQKCLEALGVPAAQWEVAAKTCEAMKKDLVGMMQPRTIGSQKYFINRNGPGFYGRPSNRWRFIP